MVKIPLLTLITHTHGLWEQLYNRSRIDAIEKILLEETLTDETMLFWITERKACFKRLRESQLRYFHGKNC